MSKSGQRGSGAVAEDARPTNADPGSLVEQLYRSHARDLCRYIAARFGAGPPEPEEIAQAAFARLAQSGVGAAANPRAYLYTIACNIAIDHQRRARHHGAVHRDLAADADPVSELSPERVLLAKERYAVFEKALKAMPAMRRRIFLLVRAEGLPVVEVARLVGLHENTVHKHVSRALQDCAAAFERAERHARRQP